MIVNYELYNGVYRFVYPKGSGVYYYLRASDVTAKAFTEHPICPVFNSSTYQDTSSKQNWTVTLIDENHLSINFASFFQGNEGDQQLEDENGTTYTLSLMPTSGEGAMTYQRVSNMKRFGSESGSTSQILQYKKQDTTEQFLEDYVQYYGSGYDNSDTSYYIKIIYHLYKCYTSSSDASSLTSMNMYVLESEASGPNAKGYCYYEVNNDGTTIQIKPLLNSAGEHITYDQLYDSINSTSTINLQSAYGHYIDKSNLYFDGTNYYFKYVNNNVATYYYYNANGTQSSVTSMDENKRLDNTAVPLNYLFSYNNEFYFCDSAKGTVYKKSNLSFSTRTVAALPGGDQISGAVQYSGWTAAGYTFNASTGEILEGTTVKFRVSSGVRPSATALDSDGSVISNLSVIYYVEDRLTKSIFFYDASNENLYKSVNFNTGLFSYTNPVTEFTYIYFNADNAFEFRPVADYYVFSNFEIHSIKVGNDENAPWQTVDLKAYAYFAVDNVNGATNLSRRKIYEGKITRQKQTTYYIQAAYNYSNNTYLKTSDGKEDYWLYDRDYLTGKSGIAQSVSIGPKLVPVEVKYSTSIVDVGDKSRYVRVFRNGESDDLLATILGKFTHDDISGKIDVSKSYSAVLSMREVEIPRLATTEDQTQTVSRETISYLNTERAYFNIDATNASNILQGFPGVKFYDGLPYVNPIFAFDVYHMQGLAANVEFVVGFNNGYYIELLNGFVSHDETGMEPATSYTDFSSVSFKDTLANLDAVSGLDNMYYVVDSTTFNNISSFRKDVKANPTKQTTFYSYYYSTETDKDTKYYLQLQDYMSLTELEKSYYNAYIKTGGSFYKRYSTLLKMTECAMNNFDDNVYFSDAYSIEYVNGEEIHTYRDNIYVVKNGEFVALTQSMAAIWKSSVIELTNIPYYDIHTYYQDQVTGEIFLTSDLFGEKDSSICQGMDELDIRVLNNSANVDMSKVIVSGLTSGYKVPYNAIELSSSKIQGYWLSRAIETYSEKLDTDKKVYLEVGVDAVILLANPLVNFDGNIFYVFKEWRVYKKENAEYFVYDKEITEGLIDRKNAILRFKQETSGYYVILPVYERIYEISIGTQTVAGTPNIGGSISIYSSETSSSIDEENYLTDLYLLQYEKDGIGLSSYNINSGVENYIKSFALFTGEFVGGSPKFVKVGISPDYKSNSNAISVILEKTSINAFGVNLFNVYIFQGTAFKSKFTVEYKKSSATLSAGKPCLISVDSSTYQFVFISDNSYLPSTGIPYNRYCFTKAQTTISGKIDKLIDAYYYTAGSTSEDARVIDVISYYGVNSNNQQLFILNDKVYSLNVNALRQPSILLSNIVKDEYVFAKVVNKQFSYVAQNDDLRAGDYYYNIENNLSNAELYYSDAGYINTSVEYKTTYYDRDSTLMFEATPATGYRLEGWYLSTFDPQYGWVVSSNKVNEEFASTYSNEIVRTEFEVGNAYVKTFEHEIKGVYPNGSSYTRKYSITNQYFDEFNIVFANNGKVVSGALKSEYCGLYANLGLSRENPKFVRVYQKQDDRSDLYYDEDFTFPVNLSDFGATYSSILALWDAYYIGYMNNYDAIDASYSFTVIDNKYVIDEAWEIVGVGKRRSTKTTYTYNAQEVYAIFTYNNNSLKYDISYFKDQNGSNFQVDSKNPNIITVKNLHSSMHLVAKFIERFQTYILCEDEQDSGISVEAVYYYNVDDTKVDVRTSSSGEVKNDVSLNSPNLKTKINYLGGYYDNGEATQYPFLINDEEDKTKSLSLFNGYWDSSNNAFSTTTSYFEQYYTQESLKNFAALSNLKSTGVVSNTGNGKISDFVSLTGKGSFERNAYGMFKTENTTLTLKNYYFDIGTTLFALIKVKVGNDLTIHSLGLNTAYTLNFLIEPMSDKIKHANDTDHLQYVYYLIKVTFDNNLEQTETLTTEMGNENPEYVLHPDKSRIVTNQVLSGENLPFYDSIFDLNVGFSDVENSTANISQNNYLTFSLNGKSRDIKISFHKNPSYEHTRTFAYSKMMAEQVFYFMFVNGAFSGLINQSDATAFENAFIHAVGSSNLTIGSNTFNVNNCVPEGSTNKADYLEAIRSYLVFAFENVCYNQTSNSFESNFSKSLSLAAKGILFYLRKFSNNVSITGVDSIYDLNYYVTVSGKVYVTDKLINQILSQPINGKALSEYLKLTDYTIALLLSLENKVYQSIGDFVGQFNQVIYASLFKKNTIYMSHATYSKEYYEIYLAAKNTDYRPSTSETNTSFVNNCYQPYLATPESRLSQIGELYLVSIRKLVSYSINPSQFSAEQSSAIEVNFGSSFFGSGDDVSYTKAKYLFKPSMPAISGRINYINLMAIKIYTISVSTSIINQYSTENLKTDEGSDIFVIDGKDTENFTFNPYYSLDDTVYVAGGVKTGLNSEDYNYMGSAEREELTEENHVEYVENYVKVHQFYTKIRNTSNKNLYAESLSVSGERNFASYGDMLFAENSIMLWGGVKTYYKIQGDLSNDAAPPEGFASITKYDKNVLKNTSGFPEVADPNYERAYFKIENGQYVVCLANSSCSKKSIFWFVKNSFIFIL